MGEKMNCRPNKCSMKFKCTKSPNFKCTHYKKDRSYDKCEYEYFGDCHSIDASTEIMIAELKMRRVDSLD